MQEREDQVPDLKDALEEQQIYDEIEKDPVRHLMPYSDLLLTDIERRIRMVYKGSQFGSAKHQRRSNLQ